MFGFDLFNKKKVAQLEQELKMANDKVASLSRDVNDLERANFELRGQLGQLPKVAARVKGAEQSWQRSHGVSAKEQPRPQASEIAKSNNHTSNYQTNQSDYLATAIVVGAAIASTRNEPQSEPECAPDVSSDTNSFDSGSCTGVGD